ncbi:MAG: pyridoxine 5'-phosphate synthase [Rubricoccaceae bacterium]
MSRTALSVNLNKVALVRNARGGGRPDLRAAAEACLRAGAHGLTLHPRPDGRHALADDVRLFARLVGEAGHERAGMAPELNVEGNPFAGPEGAYPGFLALAEETRPHQATLVPDTRAQLTSDHGWSLPDDAARLRPVIARLRALGCRVSLFIDPDPDAARAAADLGADRVELYTGPYAEAFAAGAAADVLPRYVAAAEAARSAGLGLNAGHDLDLENLGLLLRALPPVDEVSIGQALVADALHIGLTGAVRAYLDVLERVA